MRLITQAALAPAVFALALSLPLAAWAQTTTPKPATTASTETPSTDSMTSLRARVEQRIADMHATLHITAAEEKDWDQFADVMLANAQAMDSLLSTNAGKEATQNAEQILQTYAQITQLHAANVQKLSTAFEKLYTSLTSDQKKAADEMFRATAEQREQKHKQAG